MIPFLAIQSCCQELLGEISWQGTTGYLAQCPGEDLHTAPSAPGHCVVYTDGVPNLHCFHQSCSPILEDITDELRKKLRKLYRKRDLPVPWHRTTPITGTVVASPRTDELIREAKLCLPDILNQFRWHPNDAYAESKSRLIAGHQWQQHLSLFNPFDLVWIGDAWETGEHYTSHFRLAREWMEFKRQPYGQFICPSTFNKTLERGRVVQKTVDRANRNVEHRALLVLESDVLDHTESLSVVNWCRQFMRLRALIHSGNKSIHAWFDFPPAPIFEQLKITLPAMGMDSSLILKPSQPARFAGAVRLGGKHKFQHLLWFDAPNPTWKTLAPHLFPRD